MSKKLIATAAAALALSLFVPVSVAHQDGHYHRHVGGATHYPETVVLADGGGAERACLVAAAWNEARGRTDAEIIAVMHVVINRVKHPAYESTVCGVVLERGQFQMTPRVRNTVLESRRRGQFVFRGSNRIESATVDKLEALASMIIHGQSVDTTGGATHFYCPKLRRKMGYSDPPAWARKMPMTLSLGEFRFYRQKA